MASSTAVKPILAISTMDTKGAEIAYISNCLRKTGCTVLMVDLGTFKPPSVQPDVTREVVAACHPGGVAAVLKTKDRGQAVKAMGKAFIYYCQENRDSFAGFIGIGGSGGTSLITPAMCAMPVGFPKVMVSTMASGDVSAYVGGSDITMINSVADFAGINALSAIVCGNAASCLAGMVRWPPVWPKVEKAAVAMTQFGVIDEPQVRDNDSVAQYFKNAIAKLLAYGGEDSRVHLELVLEEFLNRASEKRCLKVLELAAVLGHGLNTESRVVSTDTAETG